MLSFHCSATINRRNTRISSESFSPPLSNAIKHYLTTRVSLSLSTHQAPVHTYVHVCTRVRKVENRAGGCEVEWRHAFDVPSSSWARGSLSLSLFFLPGTCATTRRRNERSTPVNQRWRAGAFPILYEHRLMNFIIRAWAFSKRFDSPDNNDNNSEYRPQIRSWKIRRIFITRLWEESRKKIPFWFIFSFINRNTVCKGLRSFIFCIRVHVCMYIRDWIDWWWLNGISLFFLCSWLFVGSKIHGAYFESSKAVDRKIFPVIFLTKI